jgi:hypothetical protein
MFIAYKIVNVLPLTIESQFMAKLIEKYNKTPKYLIPKVKNYSNIEHFNH